MEYDTIRLEADPRGAARLTLARPEKHNAMSARMIAELKQAADRIEADDSVRVVVLTGEGESFCAGGDLGWMKEQFGASREQRVDEARNLAEMLGALDNLPKPLIGRVNGQAYGGGVGMMAVCDLCIGVETAMLGFTETRLGLIPATISPYVLARIGAAAARRVFLSGRRFDAAEARELGLLARLAPAADLDAAVEAEIAAHLAAAPGAVGAAKRLVRDIGGAIDPAAIEDSIHRLADQWEETEAQEGVAAFFERRKPGWAAG